MMSPKYSRSFIDRIGKIIVDGTRSDTEVDSALVTLNEWRALHLYPMNTFQSSLRKYVGAVDANGIIAQRLKRTPTIIDKLQNRQKSMRLGTMQDVGGLRAIVDTVQSVCRIKKKFISSRAKHILKRVTDYIEEPRDSGYRGVHLVYEYRNPNRIDCDGLFIEIQLRTRLQHLWSTAVETAGFFFQESLKSSYGDERRLEFFQLVSALFAHEEGCATSLSFRPFAREELVDKLRHFEQLHGVLLQLGTIQVASQAKRHEKELASKEYWVIQTCMSTTNLGTEVLSFPVTEIRAFDKGERLRAINTYGLLESLSKHRGGGSQTVLVSTDSFVKLEKAYPNYFLNIGEFVSKVTSLIR